MRFMISTFGFAFTLMSYVQPAIAQQVKLPPASDVIARYVNASHADALVSGRKSVRTKVKVEVPAQGRTGTLEEVRARPNQVAASMIIAGRGELKFGFDGEHAWILDPAAGPRLFTGEELADRRFTASYSIVLRDSVLYPVRETVEIAEFSGQKCYRVRLVTVTKRESFECYGLESGLLVAAQRKMPTPLGMVDNLFLYSDYKEYGGAIYATKVIQEALGIRQVFTLESVVFDDARAEEFALPPAVRALIKP